MRKKLISLFWLAIIVLGEVSMPAVVSMLAFELAAYQQTTLNTVMAWAYLGLAVLLIPSGIITALERRRIHGRWYGC